jgi:DNA adenine methylase
MQDIIILPKDILKVQVPPIKCQGIKTKLVPWIIKNSYLHKKGVWIEPFMGSGVVGFNSGVINAIFNDINPHIIDFYNALKNNTITPHNVRYYLELEGYNLSQKGAEHYYEIRNRFNSNHEPLDFLFLSRAGFNGVMRFNSKGGFNIPFCKKNNRFSKSYITKIVNQIKSVQLIIRNNNWIFTCEDYKEVILKAKNNDFIYCDPPYFGRHVDYFNSWSEEDEETLVDLLQSSEAKFMLSTWHSNKYRNNASIEKFWSQYQIITKDHFYHIGANESNRNSMIEALITNYNMDNNENFILPKHHLSSEQIRHILVHSN